MQKRVWSIYSNSKPIDREELQDRYLKHLKKYGPAKGWPHDLDIFEGDGKTCMNHLSARDWEQEHVPHGVKIGKN